MIAGPGKGDHLADCSIKGRYFSTEQKVTSPLQGRSQVKNIAMVSRQKPPAVQFIGLLKLNKPLRASIAKKIAASTNNIFCILFSGSAGMLCPVLAIVLIFHKNIITGIAHRLVHCHPDQYPGRRVSCFEIILIILRTITIDKTHADLGGAA